MPYDVLMCNGGKCTLKTNCLRFTGIILARQDFFGSPPFDSSNNSCVHFMSDRPSSEKISKRAYLIWLENNCQVNKDVEYWLKAECELIDRIRNNEYV